MLFRSAVQIRKQTILVEHCEANAAVWVVRHLVAGSSQSVGESAHITFQAVLLAECSLPNR